MKLISLIIEYNKLIKRAYFCNYNAKLLIIILFLQFLPQVSKSENNDNDFFAFIEKINNERYVEAKSIMRENNYSTESCQNLTTEVDKSKCLYWVADFIKADNAICKHNLSTARDLLNSFILSEKIDPDNINAMANLIHVCLDAEDKFTGGLGGACGIIGENFNLDTAREFVKKIPDQHRLTQQLLLVRFRELENPDKINLHVKDYEEIDKSYNEYKEQNKNISIFFRRQFNSLYGRALIKNYANNKDENTFNEGIARINKSKTDMPDSIGPYLYLGEAYYKYKKNYNEAIKYYKQLLEKLKNDGDRTCVHIDSRIDCANKKLSPNTFEAQSCN